MPEQIEIDWNDVVTKLLLELRDAQKDAAIRYAMCEALKRQLDEKNTKTSDSQPS